MNKFLTGVAVGLGLCAISAYVVFKTKYQVFDKKSFIKEPAKDIAIKKTKKKDVTEGMTPFEIEEELRSEEEQKVIDEFINKMKVKWALEDAIEVIHETI